MTVLRRCSIARITSSVVVPALGFGFTAVAPAVLFIDCAEYSMLVEVVRKPQFPVVSESWVDGQTAELRKGYPSPASDPCWHTERRRSRPWIGSTEFLWR